MAKIRYREEDQQPKRGGKAIRAKMRYDQVFVPFVEEEGQRRAARDLNCPRDCDDLQVNLPGAAGAGAVGLTIDIDEFTIE